VAVRLRVSSSFSAFLLDDNESSPLFIIHLASRLLVLAVAVAGSWELFYQQVPSSVNLILFVHVGMEKKMKIKGALETSVVTLLPLSLLSLHAHALHHCFLFFFFFLVWVSIVFRPPLLTSFVISGIKTGTHLLQAAATPLPTVLLSFYDHPLPNKYTHATATSHVRCSLPHQQLDKQTNNIQREICRARRSAVASARCAPSARAIRASPTGCARCSTRGPRTARSGAVRAVAATSFFLSSSSALAPSRCVPPTISTACIR
jgi:hypothetical protein